MSISKRIWKGQHDPPPHRLPLCPPPHRLASDAMRCTRQGDAAAMRSGWELSENGGIEIDRGSDMTSEEKRRKMIEDAMADIREFEEEHDTD